MCAETAWQPQQPWGALPFWGRRAASAPWAGTRADRTQMAPHGRCLGRRGGSAAQRTQMPLLVVERTPTPAHRHCLRHETRRGDPIQSSAAGLETGRREAGGGAADHAACHRDMAGRGRGRGRGLWFPQPARASASALAQILECLIRVSASSQCALDSPNVCPKQRTRLKQGPNSTGTPTNSTRPSGRFWPRRRRRQQQHRRQQHLATPSQTTQPVTSITNPPPHYELDLPPKGHPTQHLRSELYQEANIKRSQHTLTQCSVVGGERQSR